MEKKSQPVNLIIILANNYIKVEGKNWNKKFYSFLCWKVHLKRKKRINNTKFFPKLNQKSKFLEEKKKSKKHLCVEKIFSAFKKRKTSENFLNKKYLKK